VQFSEQESNIINVLSLSKASDVVHVYPDSNSMTFEILSIDHVEYFINFDGNSQQKHHCYVAMQETHVISRSRIFIPQRIHCRIRF
jgi:hypothetical protein